MELTQVEKKFLLSLLSQVSISPQQPDAIQVCEIVQSITQKLGENDGAEKAGT